MTWKQIATQYQQELAFLYPSEEIRQLFLIVFEHLTPHKQSYYTLVQNDRVDTPLLENATSILKELATGRPIQHILGEAYFYGNCFEVSADTLIPRPETEELVHLILQNHATSPTPLRIIDIGTGSGCIPISLALKLPANYTALEVSPATMAIAQKNAQRHQVAINFMLADILEWEYLFPDDMQFDIIVSNPPYITPKEQKEMHQNVLQFEPHLALFVEEEAPLLFYDHIADFAKAHLSMEGTLYFEINQYLGTETADLLRKKGFTTVEIIKDINNADRIIRAKR